MKKWLLIIVAMVFMQNPYAQTRRTTTTKARSSAAVQQKKKTTSTQSATKRTTTTKSTAKKTTSKAPTVTNSSIKGLQNQRATIQKKIKEQESLLRANKADVKKRLDNLLTINSDIDQHQKSIVEIEKDLTHIDENIQLLETQLETLEKQLQDRKDKYVKSMRYLNKHHRIQDQLMFVFSAKNLAQMYRRMRFVREYASYQRAQGELVKGKQEQIDAKKQELVKVKKDKNNLLYKGKKAKEALQAKQVEQKKMVDTLQRQQKTIQGIIAEQRKKDQELNVLIDRLVEEEVAKARIRAAEEARKKAIAEAAAKKKREEELARKKAEAEAAAKENARRIAAAKEREEKLKEAARKAAKKDEDTRARAEQKALQAQAEREAAELKAEVDRKRREKEMADAKRESREATMLSSVDRKLSSNFESNKGRLPIPTTGTYRIVSHYGQYNVEGLRGVTLDNKGINIKVNPGAQARAIFNGEVSAVYKADGQYLVMVRHGSYISIYGNLISVNVHRGQQVSTRQALGTVDSGNILHFQLRREMTKLNPEVWLGR
ncbi:MAG: peptidoglycan DD-metalloendopeptidase family protein [Prevotella sp.]|nr:peptidoglycan DD-metalloendopeptidase family protein [Prevotella sp.]